MAATESTSISIRLNSSKEHHYPVAQSPLNNFYMILAVIESEQFITIQKRPMAFAKSFVLSVLPVPAGPNGDVLSFICNALVMVIQHFSVKGVMTSRVVAPRNSNPYGNFVFT